MEGENTKQKMERKGRGHKKKKKSEKSIRKYNFSITGWGKQGISNFQTSRQTLTIRIHPNENKSSLTMD